jgi:transposase
MAMGRQTGQQGEMILTWDELPRSPGHVFYDRLQKVLREAGFDTFVEDLCRPYYAAGLGAPSLPPGRYFRMHLVGYFEGIDSERGIEWRCADSLSLRDFLGLGLRQRVPDHSWLSRTRARLPVEVHEAVFAWVLARLAERGLVRGERIGVDASTLRANAAMRSIRRRDTGETYCEMLTRMAQASGIATPTAAELKRLDRRRKGKRTANAEWASPSDPEARITRLKDGRTRRAYKPEHAVDLDTGAIIAAAIHPADRGDTATLGGTLEAAARGLEAAGRAPWAEAPAELIADKGYHSRAVLKDLARPVADPDRRAEAQGRPALARRYGRPARGLQQPRAPALGGRRGGVPPSRREGRTELRAHPRSGRPAPGLAARPGKRAEALPRARGGLQTWAWSCARCSAPAP